MTARLPVWAIVRETLSFPFRRPASVAVGVLAPFLAQLLIAAAGLIVLALIADPQEVELSTSGEFTFGDERVLVLLGIFIFLGMTGLLAIVMIFRNLYRTAALDDFPPGFGLAFGSSMWRVLRGIIWLAFIGLGATLVVSIAYQIFGLFAIYAEWFENLVRPEGNPIPNVYVKLLLLSTGMQAGYYLPILWIFIRYVAYLPSGACDDTFTFERARELSDGHFWGTALVMLLTYVGSAIGLSILVFLLFGMGIGTWYLTEGGPLTAGMFAVFALAYLIAIIYITAVQIGGAAILYRHMTRLAPEG